MEAAESPELADALFDIPEAPVAPFEAIDVEFMDAAEFPVPFDVPFDVENPVDAPEQAVVVPPEAPVCGSSGAGAPGFLIVTVAPLLLCK